MKMIIEYNVTKTNDQPLDEKDIDAVFRAIKKFAFQHDVLFIHDPEGSAPKRAGLHAIRSRPE